MELKTYQVHSAYCSSAAIGVVLGEPRVILFPKINMGGL